jgi:hypothetical protein
MSHAPHFGYRVFPAQMLCDLRVFELPAIEVVFPLTVDPDKLGSLYICFEKYCPFVAWSRPRRGSYLRAKKLVARQICSLAFDRAIGT